MTSISSTGTQIASYAGTAMGAGLLVAVVVFGGPTAWRAFKKMTK